MLAWQGLSSVTGLFFLPSPTKDKLSVLFLPSLFYSVSPGRMEIPIAQTLKEHLNTMDGESLTCLCQKDVVLICISDFFQFPSVLTPAIQVIEQRTQRISPHC